MKKICYVTTIAETLESFVVPVAQYLAEHTDWEITMICDDDPAFAAKLPKEIRYIPVPMKRGISLDGIVATWKMLKIFRGEKFDMVQYSTPNAAPYAAVAAWLAGIKHRKYHLMGFRFLGFTGVKRWLFKTIEKLACALATDIECVSNSNMELGIEEAIFPREKAKVLFYGSSSGVDLSHFDISQREAWRQELRDKYGYTDSNCVFGFAGRITGDKGVNELFSAFRKMDDPNVRLYMVGTLEDIATLDADSLQWAKSNDTITFHDYVYDIERYFAMMDVLLLPSYREGFGNIVIEAQAMGTPVIVTDIPGPTDAMLPGETGLTVPVKDVSALQKAMETMAADKAYREQVGARGRRFVEERFDQKKLCKVILEDRKKLLGE